jgi:hypothetical protein
VAPTNILGKNSLSSYIIIISVSRILAYYNCERTSAPTLSPTASRFINCNYTIQLISSYNPAISTIILFTPGGCKVQVWQGRNITSYRPNTTITVNITDTTSIVIGHNSSSLNWDQTLGTDSQLPLVMLVTPRTGATVKNCYSFSFPPSTQQTNHQGNSCPVVLRDTIIKMEMSSTG